MSMVGTRRKGWCLTLVGSAMYAFWAANTDKPLWIKVGLWVLPALPFGLNQLARGFRRIGIRGKPAATILFIVATTLPSFWAVCLLMALTDKWILAAASAVAAAIIAIVTIAVGIQRRSRTDKAIAAPARSHPARRAPKSRGRAARRDHVVSARR